MCGDWPGYGYEPRFGPGFGLRSGPRMGECGPQFGAQFGPHLAFRRWQRMRFASTEERIRFWEEYQRDLEEELAEVSDRIARLKKAAPSQQTETA